VSDQLLQRQLPVIFGLTDRELLRRLGELVRASRRVEAVLIAHIAEVDARRLYAREAKPSMFAYCTEVLNLSEQEAYLRISVARAARQHPLLLTMLADGRLHLTGAGRIVPHLADGDAAALLERAAFKSRRAIEEMLVAFSPQSDAPTLVRRVPIPSSTPVPTSPAATALSRTPDASPRLPPAPPPQAPRPLAPDRYKVQFTVGAAFCRKLDRAKDLTRCSIPGGDIAAILEVALTEMLSRLEARRFALTKKAGADPPEGGSTGRHVPAAVRREVFRRDGGRCRFVNSEGARCSTCTLLEFHHVHPYARGGAASLANIQLMCRTHNAHLAEREFGAAHMERFRKGAPSRPPPAAPSPA